MAVVGDLGDADEGYLERREPGRQLEDGIDLEAEDGALPFFDNRPEAVDCIYEFGTIDVSTAFVKVRQVGFVRNVSLT